MMVKAPFLLFCASLSIVMFMGFSLPSGEESTSKQPTLQSTCPSSCSSNFVDSSNSLQVQLRGFQEDQLGWVYEPLGSDAAKITVSVFVNNVIFTPILQFYSTANSDPEDPKPLFNSVKDLLDNSHSATIFFQEVWDPQFGAVGFHELAGKIQNRGHSSLVVHSRKYVDEGILFRKFLIMFGPGIAPVSLYIYFDQLDYGIDLSEWKGVDDKDQKLGAGAYGFVGAVQHKKYKNWCALKKREDSWPFYNETKMLKLLRPYDSVIDIYGWTMVEGRTPELVHSTKKAHATAMILLEKMDGNAKEFLDKLHGNGVYETKDSTTFWKRVDQVAANATCGLVKGLLALKDKNYGHFDMKDENLLYKKLEGSWNFEWKISDVESVKRFADEEGNLVSYDSKKRKQEYRAPEMYTSKLLPFDARVDLFAVGTISFQLLTNRYPFEGSKESARKRGSKEYYHKFHDVESLELCGDCFTGIQISDPAKDFVTKLVRFQGSERMSLEAAIMHPWLKSCHFASLG